MIDGKWYLILFLVPLCLLGFNRSGFPIDIGPTRATLGGLAGIHVLIETPKPEIEKDGLTKKQLLKDVERKLRSAGITVLSKEEWRKEKGGPYLYVCVRIKEEEIPGSYFYNVDVDFLQRVTLVRNPGIEEFATTWSIDYLGNNMSGKGAREVVKNLVGIFINAYFSMNPK